MEKKEIIDYIEGEDVVIDDNWFYHRSPFSSKKYLDILDYGINAGNIVYHDNSRSKFISLSKKNDERYSSFNAYKTYPGFIVECNKVIGYDSPLYKKFIYTYFHKLPFTLFNDEYFAFGNIPKSSIVGMCFDVSYLIDRDIRVVDTLSALCTLPTDLDIIDLSSSKKIDKDKVKKLKFGR